MGTRAKARWIVVCDASRARVFEQHERTGPYALVLDIEHRESRAHVRDLVTDATGRKPVGVPLGSSYGGRSISLGHGRIGAAPHSDPKEVEAEKFARQLGAILEGGLYERAYEELVLVAPPAFLGLLQSVLPDDVARHVEARLGKDLTKSAAHELPARIAQALTS